MEPGKGQECPVLQRAELATLPEPENRKCAKAEPYTVENLNPNVTVITRFFHGMKL